MASNSILPPVQPAAISGGHLSRAAAWGDIAALIVATLSSAVLYIGGLGFYSDDWTILAHLRRNAHLSLATQFSSAYTEHFVSRPVEALYWCVMYWCFGAHPLGYHIVTTCLVVASAVLFYLVLRELEQPRVLALSIPLLHSLAPSYSAVRFWTAASVSSLSMTMYFLSVYADLRAATTERWRIWLWKLFSLVLLLTATLTYEVVLPLFLISPVLVEFRSRRRSGVKPRSSTTNVLLHGSTLLALCGVVAFKLMASNRLGDTNNVHAWTALAVQAFAFDWTEGDFGLNLQAAVGVHYGDYGFRLPLIVAWLARSYATPSVMIATPLFVLGVFLYLRYVSRRNDWPGSKQSALLILGGVLVFGLGYSIFLATDTVQITSMGISNRTAIAAAAGVAISLSGIVCLTGSYLSDGARRSVYCSLLISLLTGAGFVINNIGGILWRDAYRQEQSILASIFRQLPRLAPGTTMILDGACSYVGPAVVFESSWDLAGALQLQYDDPTLTADVATNRLNVTNEYLITTMYGSQERYYPYSRDLLVYDIENETVSALNNERDARRYFEASRLRRAGRCPDGKEGVGVPLW